MIRGIELVAIGKKNFFEIEYDFGAKQYRTKAGKLTEDILDMACYACGTGYYTIAGDEVEFCPHCGHFDRREFITYPDLEKWSRKNQNWGYLRHAPDIRVFAVTRGRNWSVKFAPNENVLRATGAYAEVIPLPLEEE